MSGLADIPFPLDNRAARKKRNRKNVFFPRYWHSTCNFWITELAALRPFNLFGLFTGKANGRRRSSFVLCFVGRRGYILCQQIILPSGALCVSRTFCVRLFSVIYCHYDTKSPVNITFYDGPWTLISENYIFCELSCDKI